MSNTLYSITKMKNQKYCIKYWLYLLHHIILHIAFTIDDWAWHDQKILMNQVNVLESEQERKQVNKKTCISKQVGLIINTGHTFHNEYTDLCTRNQTHLLDFD